VGDTGAMNDDLKRWWANIRQGRPVLKIGDVNNRNTKATSDYVWALKDINFECSKGSAGHHRQKKRAGKSTLLKILSKITNPTTGSIKSKGRVASLLMGTGFHGDDRSRKYLFKQGHLR
jgi:lipopolysaccharide transport system ATP-binding protein